MRLLITGAGGMLGRDVVAIAERTGHDVIALTRDDLDVTDATRARRTIERARPTAVINCAGYTDVDGAEENEPEAMLVNADGARHVAAAAAKVEARVAYVSTDYVFDGSKRRPYVESDEPAPLSAYGRTKLAGERATIEVTKRSYIVRSSWLFGPHGPNFVETMVDLARDRGRVLVVRDQVGCPTYTAHLAAGLVRLVEGPAYGIHHMAGRGQCSWFEFAEEIFELSGIECQVLSATTEMLARPAPRPPFSALVSGRETPIKLPRWQQGLSAYLARRGYVPAPVGMRASGPGVEGRPSEGDHPGEEEQESG